MSSPSSDGSTQPLSKSASSPLVSGEDDDTLELAKGVVLSEQEEENLGSKSLIDNEATTEEIVFEKVEEEATKSTTQLKPPPSSVKKSKKTPRSSFLMSVATQHEAEAETRLLQAMEQERLAAIKSGQLQSQRLNASFAGDVPRQGLPVTQDSGRSDSTPYHSAQQQPTSLLASRAQYVMALHEESIQKEEDGDVADNNENNNDQQHHPQGSSAWFSSAFSSRHHRDTMSSSRAHSHVGPDEPEVQDMPSASDSMERINRAGPVLRKAAARFQRRKAQREAQAAAEAAASEQEEEDDDDNGRRPQPSSHALAIHNATDHSGDDLEQGKPDQAHTYMGAFAAFPRKARKAIRNGLEVSRSEWSSLNDFFRPKRQSMRQECFHFLLAAFLPCFILAVILFYGFDNPPTGRCTDDKPLCGIDSNGDKEASASWYVLFIGVRQIIVFLLAKGSDIFVIDFLVLQHPRLVKMLGARISLMIVQSKGWPSVLFWWAVWDSILLYGKGAFKQHWLYWQDTFKIFTKENPSGDATYSDFHSGIILAALLISVSVALKRHFLGLYLGGRIFSRFSERMEETMKEIGLVSELALWARRKREQHATYAVWVARYAEEEDVSESVHRSTQHSDDPDTNRTDYGETERFVSERGEELDYDQILDPWDEPKRPGSNEVTGDQIIEFRQAFAVMTKPYFFSSAFGPVDTRKQCAISADRLFRRLLKLFEEDESIEVAQLMRWLYKGYHRPEEKENVALWNMLLNPDVEGRMTIVDFVKGIDTVYKKLRLLENAVANASHIDRGYERVINIVFYICVFFFALAIMGLDVLNFILGVSTLLVAFSFMIGPGAAVYFEGVMMILGRQPYDVGDKIAIGAVDEHPDDDGSPAWMVEEMDLVTTTARLLTTNEVASFNNGSLASQRIINMNRSPNPIVQIKVRFSTDTPYAKIMLFKAAVERFVAERPQEWQQVLGFRTENVDSDESFVEYKLYLMHKLTWQDRIPILESKATVAGFCIESQKQLSCRFSSASKSSINISLSDDDDDDDDDDLDTKGSPVNRSLKKLMKVATLFKTTEKKEDQT